MNKLLIQDLACPRCGHCGSFHIDVLATAYVDTGSVSVESDYYWDAASGCACSVCFYEAPAGDFNRGAGTRQAVNAQEVQS